ncbi:unnamed protein product [Orchesella dallaii]|uniref:BRCT domain-containing protein n=1 Tax=Orchesella dallaii TaxID=48710 RepID=A0ABP1RP65_9HEXA
MTNMEPAEAASLSALETLTDTKSAGGSKLLGQDAEKCIMDRKHEADENSRSSLFYSADSKCVSNFDYTDKNSTGNDSDRENSIKSVEERSTSESEPYSPLSTTECEPYSPLRITECESYSPLRITECESYSPLRITECGSDEELFESSPVCVPASPEILDVTPPKIANAFPNTLLKRSHAKRLESLDTGDMSIAKKKLFNFTDKSIDLERGAVSNTVIMDDEECMTTTTYELGIPVETLEKIAEMMCGPNFFTKSDETMEDEESENENASPNKDEIFAPGVLRFRTPSKVRKTSFGSQNQNHTSSEDFDTGYGTANASQSVISKKGEASLSEADVSPGEGNMDALEDDSTVQGEIDMLNSGIIKTLIPAMAAEPLRESSGSDEDLFGLDMSAIFRQAAQLTPHPPSDNIDTVSTVEKVAKEQTKSVKRTWEYKKRPTIRRGKCPPPVVIRKSRKRKRERSPSSLDSMPLLPTPQFTVSPRTPSTKRDARSALEKILDLGTGEERELREIDLSQKPRRAAVPDKSKRFSTLAKEKRNAKGETQLHIACRNGNIQKVQELLENGAEIGARDFAGWIPLHEAVSGKGTDGAKAAIVKLLCQKGCNVNALGGFVGDTPLHEAAFYGLERIVEILLSFGAVPSIRNSDGKLPRDVSDNNFIIKLLEKRAGDKSMSLNTMSMAYLALEDPSLQQIRSQSAIFFFNFDISERVLHEIMTRLNLRWSSTLSDKVTHIVYETSTEDEENLLVPFGWEYMYGLAKGLWQISFHWIGESLYHSRCLPLNDFEISGCREPTDEAFGLLNWQSFSGTTGIPGLSRANREKGNPGLFQGFTFYSYKGCGFGNLNKKNIGYLAACAGAQLTNREPNPETIDPLEFPSRFHTLGDNNHIFALTTHVILYTNREAPPESKKYAMEHVKTLKLDWLVASVGHFQLADSDGFL